jgi:hypothetical protein
MLDVLLALGLLAALIALDILALAFGADSRPPMSPWPPVL